MSVSTGIKNLEGTCYMNAAIQCFNSIEELSTYLLKLNNIPKNTIILGEYINIIKGLRNNSKPCNVTKFRQNMEKVNKLFKGNKGNDPSDFILYFLNSLENDLKKYGNYELWFYKNIKNNEDLKELYDFNIGKTIINDLFNFITQEEMICICNTHNYNYQTQQFMLLNINSDDSIENILYNNNNKQFYSQLTCKICKNPFLIKNSIKIGPKYLIIVLNSVNKYYKHNVSFNEYIFINEENKKLKYIFTGMIVHLGSNSDSGHFIAYCRNTKYNTFYEFNDTNVKEVDFEQVKEKSPYILFYKRTFDDINKETKIESLKYKISGNLNVKLFCGNKNIIMSLNFTEKKINFRIDDNNNKNNYDYANINNLINKYNKNDSLFKLADLDENLRKLQSDINNSIIYGY